MNTVGTINRSGKNITFSGTDTIAFIMLPNTAPIVLGSLTTLSYSSYRVKTPVPTLGGIRTKGVAKGGRTIAGTMVFTLINQHWVNELLSNIPWLKSKADGVIYSDELPIFDLMVVSANEYGKYVSMCLYGIDFTDEAGVLSVNDMYAENTFSYIAREIKTFNDSPIPLKSVRYNSNKALVYTNGFTQGVWKTNEYVPNYDKKDWEYPIMTYDTYPKDCRVILEDLGYKAPPRKPNIIIPEDPVTKIMKDMELINYSREWFIKKVIPNITKEYIKGNHYIVKHNSNSYINTDMSIRNDIIEEGERVVVFDEGTSSDKSNVVLTNKGWIDKDNIIKKVKDMKSGITDIRVKDQTVLDKVKKGEVTITPSSLKEFINNFSILATSSEYEKYITNVSIEDENGVYRNNLKNIISNGDINLNFKDRLDFIIKYANPKAIINFIIINSKTNESYIIKVKLERYSKAEVFNGTV